MKHAAICKHLPTCTQLIKQAHRLLFPVICFCFFTYIYKRSRVVFSIYWMDSQVPPAAAPPLRVASGQRARPAVYIQPSAVTISCFCFPALQTRWDDLWASGRRLIRAVLVKMCFGIYTQDFFEGLVGGGLSLSHITHPSALKVGGEPRRAVEGGREGAGSSAILRNPNFGNGLHQTVDTSHLLRSMRTGDLIIRNLLPSSVFGFEPWNVYY